MNANECYLHTKKSRCILNFGRTLTISSVYLYSAGQMTATGVIVPRNATLMGLAVYDGSQSQATTEHFIPMSAGDRIGVRAVYDNPTFTLIVQVNGANTEIQLSEVLANSDVTASVLIELIEK